MRDVVEEIDSGWRIPLAGFAAESVQGLGNRHLRLVDEDAEAFVLVPDELVSDIEALAASGAVVADATVDRGSTLTIDFGEGRLLAIPPDPNYESWEVQGPGEIQVVAMPGGGEPAIWDGTSKIYRVVDGKLVETTEGDGQ